MPYSITTKDGITINNIPDDVPADHPDLKARVAKIRGGQPPAASPAPAPEKLANGVDDPGVMGSLLPAAGHTFDSILDGLTQMVLSARGETSALAGLKKNVEEKEGHYAPLKDAHPVATAVGESLPAMAIPVGGGATMGGTLARLGAAGAIPGALEYGTVEERAKRAAGGAAAGVAGGVLIPKLLQVGAKAIPAIGRTAKAVFEPLYEAGRNQIAGRALNTAAGSDAAAVATRLGTAAPVIPGSMPTAGQVAENGGIAALERAAAARQPADFTARNMEQAAARLQALRGVAGDEGTKAAAIAARKAATDPLYEQAKRANYTVDPRLERLLQTPSMQQALKRAEKLAADNQRTFAFEVPALNTYSGVGLPGKASTQVTGQGLQDLKMAIDEMLTDPTSGFAGKAGDAVKGLRGQLLNWMEGANPAFKQARTTFSDMSKPINQMDIGTTLLQKVEPALNDFGQLGSETGAKYALALRNADQTARQATKFKGAGMADIMEPAQMDLLNGVAADLARKANAGNLGRGPGSNTFQNFAMDNIAGRSGAPRVMGAAMNLPGVSKVGKFLYSGPEEQIQTLLAQSLLDPKMAARLMQGNLSARAPQSMSDFLLANPSRAVQLGGGATGLSLGSLFSQ